MMNSFNSDKGGSISIIGGTSESYKDVGKAYYADNNEQVTAVAEPNIGYLFKGWYDENNNLISPNSSYSYAFLCWLLSLGYKDDK